MEIKFSPTKLWWKYIKPKRLTLKKNPAVYRWVCLVFYNSMEKGGPK